MALKKSLYQRLLEVPKSAAWSVRNCRISSSSPSTRTRMPPDLGDSGILRRLLHKRAGQQPEVRAFPVVDGLMEKLRMMDAGRERIRLDGLIRPPHVEMEMKRSDPVEGLTVEDARKLLRLAQLEAVKMKLEGMKESWISYDRLVEICSEDCGKEGLGVAKILDQSGAVIVLGDMVFLHPQQVVKTIRGLIPVPAARPDDALREELDEMEKEKAVIDKKAEELVRRELWGGLAYMVVQTAAFMRLTFWELTWDVMEPICFYVTSFYFMGSYAFFLRTSQEPSFEGFFKSRFNAKQKKLMRMSNFDLGRYSELKKACSPHDSWPEHGQHSPLSFDPLRLKRGSSGGCAYQ
uniref:Calcium uniporter protein C-terminal domain-containing protein n=1 Tax=Kalanchoe fedtschenkoi TaxID=63787 RepID=A0A7N0UC56_KALFE